MKPTLILIMFVVFCTVQVRAQAIEWMHAGLSGITVVTACKVEDGTIFVGSSAGVFRSNGEDTAWVAVNNGLTDLNVLAISANAGDTLFAGTGSLGVFRSTDLGDSWHAASSGLGSSPVNDLAPSPGGALFACTGDLAGGGLFRSTNGGDSWVRIDVGFSLPWIQAVGVNGQGTVVAGTAEGTYYRSTDNGTSWSQVFAPGNWAPNDFSTNENGDFFAGSTGVGVYRSTDDGVTWEFFDPSFVYAVEVNSIGDVFAGLANDGGVRRSQDNGVSWVPVNNGLVHRNVRSLVANANGILYAGTEGGVYRTTLSTTDVPSHDGSIPVQLALSQNYPNPFNAITTFEFRLPARQVGFLAGQAGIANLPHVVLKVYDVRGREVATILDEQLAPGVYTRQWNATGVASGVYFYKLETPGEVSTKRLILIR
jgi:hypothetical protein